MKKVTVKLAERSYYILINTGILENIGELIAELKLGKKGVVVTDDIVAPLYSDKVINALKKAGFDVNLISMPSGEKHKSLETVRAIYSQMLKYELDRKSFLISLGGGVIGDLAGFAAATYMRGIPYIQIPTTLLAQVDSSIGGKTGVNLPEGKNLIGAFYQPKAVFIDIDVLKSLPKRETKAGFVEIVKHGIIKDKRFFKFLEENYTEIFSLHKDITEKAIARSCEIKASVVEKDEKEETGLRAILNFGHTIGHCLESLSSYEKYRHGEAISIGIVCAAEVSAKLGYTEQTDAKRIITFLQRCGLPVSFDDITPNDILSVIYRDKKVIDRKMRFVLIKGIGSVFVADDVEIYIIKEALEEKYRPKK